MECSNFMKGMNSHIKLFFPNCVSSSVFMLKCNKLIVPIITIKFHE